MQNGETIWLVVNERHVKELFTGQKEVEYDLWLERGEEPPLSQDEGWLQIPVRELILTAWQPHEEMT